MTAVLTTGQAQALAKSFGNNEPIAVADDSGPMIQGLIRHGWIAPTGKSGLLGTGEAFQEHVLTKAGLSALAAFLNAAVED